MEQRIGLSNMQMELLKMFTHDLPEEQLQEIKQLLAKYFESKVNDEMDALWEKKGWSDVQMDTWAKEHMRNRSRKPIPKVI